MALWVSFGKVVKKPSPAVKKVSDDMHLARPLTKQQDPNTSTPHQPREFSQMLRFREFGCFAGNEKRRGRFECRIELAVASCRSNRPRIADSCDDRFVRKAAAFEIITEGRLCSARHVQRITRPGMFCEVSQNPGRLCQFPGGQVVLCPPQSNYQQQHDGRSRTDTHEGLMWASSQGACTECDQYEHRGKNEEKRPWVVRILAYPNCAACDERGRDEKE